MQKHVGMCVCVCTRVHGLSHVRFFAVPWTVAHQTPLSMGFPRQEYWSGLPFPTLGDLPHPGIELTSLVSSALAGGFFTTAPPGKPQWKASFTLLLHICVFIEYTVLFSYLFSSFILHTGN